VLEREDEMTPQQKKNTKKLVNFLENVVHPKKFNLGYWVRGNDPKGMAARASEPNHCKTSACVIGWFPHLFPSIARWIEYGTEYGVCPHPSAKIEEVHFSDDEANLFTNVTGLLEASRIIYPQSDIPGYCRPTPKRVAKEIRAVAKEEHGFEW